MMPKGLLVSAIKDNNPVIFIEHKLLYKNKKYIEHVPEELYEIPLGKGEIKRPGKDITLVATSFMVKKCLETAETALQEKNIDCEVIDPRTLRPLDIGYYFKLCKKNRQAYLR